MDEFTVPTLQSQRQLEGGYTWFEDEGRLNIDGHCCGVTLDEDQELDLLHYLMLKYGEINR